MGIGAALTPTQEQQAIIEAARTGRHLVIQAGAGTGKTSTLKMVAAALDSRPTIYVAYNAAIAKEAAASFPAHVTCKTAHALAMGAVGRRYRHRLGGARQPARRAAELLGTGWLELRRDLSVSPVQLARIAVDTVRAFCYSAEADIDCRHVPAQNGIIGADHHALAAAVLPYARRAWSDLRDPDGMLRYEHDHYLKSWTLTAPLLDADVILLDEAQDCQPEGTKVMTVSGLQPIETLQVGDRVVSYTPKSLRLRMLGSAITSISSRHIDEEIVCVRTESGLSTRYTEGHICLAKVGPAIEGKTILYLMKRGTAWRVGVTSAHHGRQGKNRSSGIAGRLRDEDADAIWILDVFDVKADALVVEAAIPAKFGIPEMRFIDNGHRTFGQDRLDVFWHDMGDLTDKATRLLAAYGRRVEYPLATRSFSVAGTRNGTLLYSRTATVRACNLLPGMLVLDTRPLFGRRSQLQRRFDDPAWSPVAVERQLYKGVVWSIEVENDHTYIGDGIVTHNCNPCVAQLIQGQTHAQQIAVGDSNQSLYGWRGARDALGGWPADQRLYLSQSWRFGPGIAAEANKWLHVIDTPLRLTGNPGMDSQLVELDAPKAVLCRTNAEAMKQVMAMLGEGQRVALAGGGSTIRRLAEAAAQLKDGRRTNHPELYVFPTWAALQDYVEQEEAGRDLKPFVDLIDAHGAEAIIAAIDALVDERRAQTVVSTSHKAKGREWESVKIAADYPQPKPDYGRPGPVPRTDAMLAYVAVTRARSRLDRGGLAWIDHHLQPAPDPGRRCADRRNPPHHHRPTTLPGVGGG
jgi:hypothetical protein